MFSYARETSLTPRLEKAQCNTCWFAKTLNDASFVSKVWKSAQTAGAYLGCPSMKQQVVFLPVPEYVGSIGGEHGLISRNSHDRNPNICRSLIRTSSNARATCGSQLRITRMRSVHLFVLPHGFSSKGETTRSLPVVHCCTPLPVLHALN